MALNDDVRSLASNATLRDLEPDALRLIAFSAETRILRAGDVLFRQGDVSDAGYVVLGGSITMESDAAPPTTVEAPALIGNSALIVETIRPATAFAREASSVLKISRVLFHRVLSEYPESAARLRQTLAGRLIALGRDLDGVRTGALG